MVVQPCPEQVGRSLLNSLYHEHLKQESNQKGWHRKLVTIGHYFCLEATSTQEAKQAMVLLIIRFHLSRFCISFTKWILAHQFCS